MIAGESPPVRSDRKTARRDRTKSPQTKITTTASNGSMDDGSIQIQSSGSTEDKAERRKSAANFSATSLLENLKETNAPSITRLRRTTSSDGTDGTARSSGRRPLGRTMSGQAPRGANGRRTANDVLSMSMDGLNYDTKNDMDASNSMSSSNGNRRRVPQRTRSMQDSCFPRGHPGTAQRGPRARRKPGRDGEESTEDTMDSSALRRRPPPRTRSYQDAVPPRGAYQRAARPGRRRPGREVADDDNDDDDEEDVLISDSDEEEQRKDNNMDRPTPNNNMDRSTASAVGGSRRRVPQRTRSAQDSCLPRGHAGYQRTSRAARRRPSNDSGGGGDDGSQGSLPPTSRRTAGGGPGLRRSNTGTPPPSSSGPALGRSLTAQNARSNRIRGSRNTAAELARVACNSREASPDDLARSPSPERATDALRNSAKHSVSPIKSRQARRRLREDKEREGMERHLSNSVEREPKMKPEKKEEPWMRRLKKNVVKSNDDSMVFDEVSTARSIDRSNGSNNDSSVKGSSLPSIGQNQDFFHTDPSFGVFPASKAEAIYQSSSEKLDLNEEELKKEQKGAMMEMANDKNKFDFSSIS